MTDSKIGGKLADKKPKLKKPQDVQMSIDELKSLIIWAKGQKVKILELSGIKVEFTELAFINEVQGLDAIQGPNPEVTASTQTFADDLNEDDEDLLFHSSRP